MSPACRGGLTDDADVNKATAKKLLYQTYSYIHRYVNVQMSAKPLQNSYYVKLTHIYKDMSTDVNKASAK